MALNWQAPIVPSGMKFNPGDTSFVNQLFNCWVPLEAPSLAQRQHVTLVPQAANKNLFDPTIGIGFDLITGGAPAQNLVFIGLEFVSSVVASSSAPSPGTQVATEYNYLARIRADISAGTSATVSDMNAVMAQRNAQYQSNSLFSTFINGGTTVPQRNSFAFLNDTEVFDVFSSLWTSFYQPLILTAYRRCKLTSHRRRRGK